MNGKWTHILKASGQADLGAALVWLARHAADAHRALMASPGSGQAVEPSQDAPVQWPAQRRGNVQEARS